MKCSLFQCSTTTTTTAAPPVSAPFFLSLLPPNRLLTTSIVKHELLCAIRARRRRHSRPPKCPIPLSKVSLTSNSPFSRRLAIDKSKKKNNIQVLVAQKVATGVYKGVTTTELDELAAETAASMTATHPDYAVVSLRDEEERGRESLRAQKEWSRRRIRLPLLSLVSPRMSRRCLSLCPPLSLAHPRSPPLSLSLSLILTHSTQLAARIAVSNLHKNTLKSFSET